MQDGGGDVGEDAVGAQARLGKLRDDEVERHGIGGVRREGFACIVLDQLLGVLFVRLFFGFEFRADLVAVANQFIALLRKLAELLRVIGV